MSMGISAGLDLAVSLGEKVDVMNDHLSAIRRHTRAAQIGRTHPASATVKLSSIATFTLPSQLTELCSPPTGMVWFVERITFAPPMLGTGAGGTIILFRGSVECW